MIKVVITKRIKSIRFAGIRKTSIKLSNFSYGSFNEMMKVQAENKK